jgi:hypothetical protein
MPQSNEMATMRQIGRLSRPLVQSSDRSRRAGDLVISPKRAFGETTMPPARLVARFPQRDFRPTTRSKEEVLPIVRAS